MSVASKRLILSIFLISSVTFCHTCFQQGAAAQELSGHGIVPAPVSFRADGGFSQARKLQAKLGDAAFRDAVQGLEPWQQQEAYRLIIGPKKIVIEALTDEGLFRARTTLEQWQAQGPLPCCTILDYPQSPIPNPQSPIPILIYIFL